MPILDKSEYFELYNAGNLNWVFDENRNGWKILKDFIQKHIPEKSNILDFGCNLGDVLYRMPDKFEKFGIEINERASEIAQTKSDATVWKGYDFIPADIEFDMIFAIDVIKHLLSHKRFILQSFPHVKRGGYIALMTGDSNN